MDGKLRREKIIDLLSTKEEAVTGSGFAKLLNVSRQVIVQDIAIIRAQGIPIIATAEGYRIYKNTKETMRRVFCVRHTSEEIEEELYTIVDHGGVLKDIIIEHSVYGEIKLDLMIGSRVAAFNFCKKLVSDQSEPLLNLTGGVHYHTVEAKDEHILAQIEEALKKKGYLIS